MPLSLYGKEYKINVTAEININEKVHIAIGMIDNLCHEIVYHKHEQLDYNKMIEFVISTITNLLK